MESNVVSNGYRVETATPDDIGWMARLEAETYSSSDAVPESVLREWYAVSPRGFFVLRKGDERVGHLDLLPLRPTPLRRFLAGELREREIRGEDLYSTAERASVTSLYVESLVVLPVSAYARAAALSLLLLNLTRLVGLVADPRRVEELYAVAASEAGARLMRRLGFRPLQKAAERGDGHELLTATLAGLQATAASVGQARRSGRSVARRDGG